MSRKDETFVVFNFDEYFTKFDDNPVGILCISERDRAILISVLRFALWPSRWVGNIDDIFHDDYKNSLLRNTGRLADLHTALDYVEKLEAQINMAECNFELLAEGLMAMGTSIKEGLIAIATRPCCNDGVNLSIIQGATEGGNTLYGEQSPGGMSNEGEGDPPEGWETWEDYFQHKCSVAHFIVDSLLTSMRQLAFIELVGLTVGSVAIGAALAGCISLGPAGIPILVAALIVAGVLEGLALLVEDYLEDNRTELVCALYNSETTQEAIDILMEYIDEGIGAIAVSLPVGAAIRVIALLLAGTDTINQLFTNTLAIAYPDADCSGCEEEEPTWTIRYGSGTINYDTSFTMSSSFVSGFYLVALSGELRECTMTNLSGYTNYVGNDFRAGTGVWGEEPSGDVWDSDTPFSGTLCCRQWSLASASPFTVDCTIGDECT